MADIAQADHVVGVLLKNEKGNRDKWLYWEIVYETANATRWTIEIYYSVPGDPYFRWPQRFAAAMRKCLTDEHRYAILGIKESLQQKEKWNGIESFDVYRAVLDGCVRSLPVFMEWLKTNKTKGIGPWVPGQ